MASPAVATKGTSDYPSRSMNGPLPSVGVVVALGVVGLAGVALSALGLADSGAGDSWRLVVSIVGGVSGLVTIGAAAAAAGRRRRGLFDAERQIAKLERLAERIEGDRNAPSPDRVKETLRQSRALADELAMAGAFRQSVAVDRAISDVEDAEATPRVAANGMAPEPVAAEPERTENRPRFTT